MLLNTFKILDHPSDTGIKVRAETLKRLFEICAEAMFAIMCDLNAVKPDKMKKIKIFEKTHLKPDELLISWLENLLYIHETQKMLFSSFCVRHLITQDINKDLFLSVKSGNKNCFCNRGDKKNIKQDDKASFAEGPLLIAEAYGQKIDFSKHEIFASIKAPTYHMLQVKKDKRTGYWNAQVIFDV